jgi:hypothetical protein
MKPALALTLGLLILSLLFDNHITYYYGQLLPNNIPLSMIMDTLVILALFILARKLSSWLK